MSKPISEMDKKFVQGYACAVASIVKSHGESTATTEALGACGIRTREKAEMYGVDNHDLEILYPKEKP